MYLNDNKLFFHGIIKYLIKFRNYLTALDLFLSHNIFFGCGYSDEVITNVSKIPSDSAPIGFCTQTTELGLFGPPDQMVTDAI